MCKTAFITGGTRGIGRAIAVKLKSLGYNVVITYIDSDKNAEELNKNYGIIPIKADVSNYEVMNSAVLNVAKKFGKIDVVINNAGICLPQKLLIDCDEAEFDKVIAVNVKGVFNVMKSAIPLMLDGGGIIVNVSSVQGVTGGSCEAVYSASKSAIIGLTRAVSEELDSSNITVFSVSPTLTETDMNAHLSSKEKLEFLSESGLNYIPTPEQVADEIFELMQKDRNVLNGKNFLLSTK